jgi:hypothetical protein
MQRLIAGGSDEITLNRLAIDRTDKAGGVEMEGPG